MVIHMRGEPISMTVPADLQERILDYVIHVLGTLAQVFSTPGMTPKLRYGYGCAITHDKASLSYH
jgi:hypothetical protein